MAPGVAVVGCGRWGRHLVRTFAGLGALRAVVDTDAGRAAQMSERFGVRAVDLDSALGDTAVEAVVVATPAASHAAVAGRALAAGRHVLVEKPLALGVDAAATLCRQAAAAGLVLMVGHLLRYHPAFVRLEAMAADGSLGRLRHLYASRLSLGRIRPGENVLWSFAPHDVSMVLALVAEEPETVAAIGGERLDGRSPGVTTSLAFPGGARAQVLSSWLHPFKEQRLVVVGDKAMAVFDDRRPWPSKLVFHPHVVDWHHRWPEPIEADGRPVAVDEMEPLAAECGHFLACVESGTTPRTDGEEGVRVLRVLEAAQRSLASGRAHPPPRPRPRSSSHRCRGRTRWWRWPRSWRRGRRGSAAARRCARRGGRPRW
jgi:UDP-2-acetamido-3-amino-2,3-dideoxy-glucuronate N-acetyltransferase